jgi:hypothetical protein
MAVVEGASVLPARDLLLADLPRETANDVIDPLREIGVHEGRGYPDGAHSHVDLSAGI